MSWISPPENLLENNCDFLVQKETPRLCLAKPGDTYLPGPQEVADGIARNAAQQLAGFLDRVQRAVLHGSLGAFEGAISSSCSPFRTVLAVDSPRRLHCLYVA